MAKVIITDDEEEALGILRMLDISKNKAFDLLESYGLTHDKAINILRDILKLSEKDAGKYLESILDKESIDELIPLLYKSDMPQAYFIASFDMIGKMRSISHIGNWDFKRGDIWIHSKSHPAEFINYLKKEYGYTNEAVEDLLENLRFLNDPEALGWISKISSIDFESKSRKYKKEENLLIFDNGLVLDLANFNAYIFRGRDIDIGIPYSVVYIEDGALKEKILKDSNLDISVLLNTQDKDSYESIFVSKDLSKSMFTRMYFFKGTGLKYFKGLHQEKTLEGNSVYVYKIEWPQ